MFTCYNSYCPLPTGGPRGDRGGGRGGGFGGGRGGGGGGKLCAYSLFVVARQCHSQSNVFMLYTCTWS